MTTETDAERMLDKTLEDTFPASDALSTLPNPSVDSFVSREQLAGQDHAQHTSNEWDLDRSQHQRNCA